MVPKPHAGAYGRRFPIVPRDRPFMRMLLVEDNEGLGDAVNRHLRGAGHAVEWVRSAEDAVEAFGLDTFDAVILELILPGLHGFATASRLREMQSADWAA